MSQGTNMRNIGTWLWLLWLLWFGPIDARAATYYVDADCAHNGDGTTTTCASDAGKPGPYNCSAEIPAKKETGDDLLFKYGTTCNRLISVKWGGTASDYAEIGPYGPPGAKPVITNYMTQTGPWKLYSGAIYYAMYLPFSRNPANRQVNVLTQDGTRLRAVSWDTNIAATAPRMGAGSFTLDNINNVIYLWTTDSVSPAGKTILYGAMDNSGFCLSTLTYGQPNKSQDYLYIHDLDLRLCNMSNLAIAENESAISDHSIVERVDADLCGGACFNLGGNGQIIRYNTSNDSGSEAKPIQPGFVINGGNPSGEGARGMDVHHNVCRNTRNGSCFEMNFGPSYSAFHHNEGYNYVVNFLELWRSANHNLIYDNFGDNRVLAFCAIPETNRTYPEGRCRGEFSAGIVVHFKSNGNKIYNNIMLGGRTAGYSVGAGGSACGCNDNLFYNNYAKNTDSDKFYGLKVHQSCSDQRGNSFTNNIVEAALGYGIFFPASIDGNFSDHNDLYADAFGKLGKQGTPMTLAEWTTATALDVHSTGANPRVTAKYTLSADSPARDTGDNSTCAADDFFGTPRPINGICDMGPQEYGK